MPKQLLYVLLVCILALISTELMLNSLVGGYTTRGYAILWILIPATLVFALGAWAMTRIIVPHTLYKGRYLRFCLLTFATSYILMLIYLLIETAGSLWAGVQPRADDWSESIIYLERFCDSTIMTVILFGMGAYAAYGEWIRVSRMEKELAVTLRTYISTVRTRLDSRQIHRGLDEIEDSIREGDTDPADAIDRFSDYLRQQLYELPKPPSAEDYRPKEAAGKVAEFLIDRKWRKWRHIALQFLLLIMGTEFFFASPTTIEISPLTIGLAIGMYGFLNLLVAINRFWLYRRFHRHRSPIRYLTEASLIIICPVSIYVIANLTRTDLSPIEVFHPFWIVIPASVGAIMSLTLFEIGITVIFLMKYRAKVQMRADSLAAETARQEYLFLKKQINPHFLFNVINNVSILSYESREEALRMLEELRRLIDYQFEETVKSFTSPRKELSFLDSYMRLETSRTDNLIFSINYRLPYKDVSIPTLLLIPIVENAVKHSRGVKEMREVSIFMQQTESLLKFRCSNNYNPENNSEVRDDRQRGGLGISNLQRRLSLLYGEDYTLRNVREKGIYEVLLEIPLSLSGQSGEMTGHF